MMPLGPPRRLGPVCVLSAARGRVWPRGSLAEFSPSVAPGSPGKRGRDRQTPVRPRAARGEARASQAKQIDTPGTSQIDRPARGRSPPPPVVARRARPQLPATPSPCAHRTPPPHQPKPIMEAPPPPPPAAPPKKKPPQSTQPETAEDGQTLFDDELDRLLPVGTVASVMRAAIPQEAKIGRDAREAAQDCASEFVAFVASEASDACAAAGSASASESTLRGPNRLL